MSDVQGGVEGNKQKPTKNSGMGEKRRGELTQLDTFVP